MRSVDVKSSTYTDFNEEKQKGKSKKNCDKLYVKWKSYDNSFNSWIDNKKT